MADEKIKFVEPGKLLKEYLIQVLTFTFKVLYTFQIQVIKKIVRPSQYHQYQCLSQFFV